MTGRVPRPLRVLVVDDQQIMREGLVALLELLDDIEVVGDAADGARAVELVAETAPDVVLMDLRMPVLDGVGATERIVAEHPEVAVLVLTTYADDESISTALLAGARGYLTKDAGRAEIAAALRAANAGQSTFDSAVSERLVAALAARATGGPEPAPPRPVGESRPDRLTAREVEVLRLIADGLSNGDIATALFIGKTTVKTHINNAFAKIGVTNRSDAVRYAYRHGIATP